eukprot:gene7011-20593_t
MPPAVDVHVKVAAAEPRAMAELLAARQRVGRQLGEH